MSNGDGTFTSHLDYPFSSTLAAADLNGDGRLDLFVLSGAGAVDMLFGSCR